MIGAGLPRNTPFVGDHTNSIRLGVKAVERPEGWDMEAYAMEPFVLVCSTEEIAALCREAHATGALMLHHDRLWKLTAISDDGGKVEVLYEYVSMRTPEYIRYGLSGDPRQPLGSAQLFHHARR